MVQALVTGWVTQSSVNSSTGCLEWFVRAHGVRSFMHYNKTKTM